MTPDTAVVSEAIGERAEVMASVDTHGTDERLIIADVSTDDAWVSMRMPERTSLSAWR